MHVLKDYVKVREHAYDLYIDTAGFELLSNPSVDKKLTVNIYDNTGKKIRDIEIEKLERLSEINFDDVIDIFSILKLDVEETKDLSELEDIDMSIIEAEEEYGKEHVGVMFNTLFIVA